MALRHTVVVTPIENLVDRIQNRICLPWQDSQASLHCKEPYLVKSVPDHQQCNTSSLLWWEARERHCPWKCHGKAYQELPVLCWAGLGHSSSTLAMSVMDPEWRTRNREPRLQLHTQRNTTLRGSPVPDLGRRRWSWVITDLERRGSTSSATNTSSQWKAKHCICMKNKRLTGPSAAPPQMARQDLWEVLPCSTFFLRTNHTAITLTRNYYMPW